MCPNKDHKVGTGTEESIFFTSETGADQGTSRGGGGRIFKKKFENFVERFLGRPPN